jgi:hypothetical protein
MPERRPEIKSRIHLALHQHSATNAMESAFVFLQRLDRVSGIGWWVGGVVASNGSFSQGGPTRWLSWVRVPAVTSSGTTNV